MHVGSSYDPISAGSSRRSSQLSNTGGAPSIGHSGSHILAAGMASHLQRLQMRITGGNHDPLYNTSNLVLQVSPPLFLMRNSIIRFSQFPAYKPLI